MQNFKSLQFARFVQSGVLIQWQGLNLYIDPIQLNNVQSELPKADFVFYTHEHDDHLDAESLTKIFKPETVIVANAIVLDKLMQSEVMFDAVIEVAPIQSLKLDAAAQAFSVTTIPAYNIDKFRAPGELYHPPEREGVGYILELGNIKVAHLGDTDLIEVHSELQDIDLLFIPVSGTYVMTPSEAAEATKIIKPQLAVPMHYDKRVGGPETAVEFKELAAPLVVQIVDALV
jgi:L-ascorbate metabolism protein UlaG (beta-lactamase superfamily)